MLTRRAFLGAAGLTLLTRRSAQADPAVMGAWGPPVLLPNIAIHACVIPNTQAIWHASSKNLSPSLGTHSWIYDPVTAMTTMTNVPWSYDMMCGGTSLLAEGRIFVTGGRINANQTATFDPVARHWEPGPRLPVALYYPTNVTAASGRVYVYFGRSNKVFEYDPTLELGEQEFLEQLPASANRTMTNSLYPKVHLLPDGRHFLAGVDMQTALFDEATESWTNAGRMPFPRFEGATVPLPGGCRILTYGGGEGATRLSGAIIDPCAPAPAWRPLAARMAVGRQAFNMVLLPDGTIFTVGGRSVSAAERFDPDTETFTPLAPASTVRGYHSTAVLLPDGTVFVAGNAAGAEAKTGETFSPPYLFKGARPSLTVAGGGYGGRLTVGSSQPIAKLSLIRTGAVSHGTNVEQRLLWLSPSAPTLPTNRAEAPPGWYLLFALNSAGVPSIGRWLRLG